MARLNFDCEELLHWWEPKTDLSFIFNFNWRSLQQLREAITIFLSSRLNAMSQRATKAITETGCPHLKCMMASNPSTPGDLLEFLSQVSTVPVLIRIAENENTPKETLSKLAYHHDPEVRAAVADNTNTPDTCFKRLSLDESVDVRYRLAENPNAPLASLYNVLKDENPYVSQRAKLTLSRILFNALATEAAEAHRQDASTPSESMMRRSILHDSERNRQMIAELNEICGYDFVAIEFSNFPRASAV